MEELDHSKTEEATPFKREQARKKGMVARGMDLGVFAGIASLSGYLWIFGDEFGAQIARACQRGFVLASQVSSGQRELWLVINVLLTDVVQAFLPLMGIVVFAALLSGIAQSGFIFSFVALKPDFSRLSPANGFKRVFSMQTIFETIKSSLKLIVYSTIAFIVIRESIEPALHLSGEPIGIVVFFKQNGLKLIMCFSIAAIIFAVVDQIIVRRQFGIKMRMSRRELRDEVRNREGEPRIKQRRKQLHQELLKRSKSMRNVRGADMLIANPTHFVVGLKYEAEKMAAPTVVVRGAGEFAVKLKKLAFIYGVPIIEDRDLARQLYLKSQLEKEIPLVCFQATAAHYLKLRKQRAERGHLSYGLA